MDIRYSNFSICLELARSVKERKMITQRIVTLKDISNVLAYIKKAYEDGSLDEYRYQHYTAFILFGAYTGTEEYGYYLKINSWAINSALGSEKPVLLVKSSQDKIRMEHYVPIHPGIVDLL